MSGRISRRTLLAGLAAMPALTTVGCEFDRTTADPIGTVDTLNFTNRLRIPALAESTLELRNSSPAYRRRPGAIPMVDTPWDTSARRCARRAVNRFG
jgi:hypothetical protein